MDGVHLRSTEMLKGRIVLELLTERNEMPSSQYTHNPHTHKKEQQ